MSNHSSSLIPTQGSKALADRVVLRQALKDTFRSIKKHWLGALIYAIAPIPLLALVGAIANGYIGVTLLGTFLFYIAALVVIFLSHLARAPFALLAEHGRQIAELSARFEQVQHLGQSQRPIVIVQGTPDPPNLICSTHERLLYRRDDGVIFERDAGEGSETDFRGVTADFNNRIEEKRRVGEVSDVSARLSFHAWDDPGYWLTLHRGHWLREKSGRVNIGRNDTRELVVATFEDSRLYAIKQLTDAERATQRVELPEGPFSVNVRLIAESDNKSLKSVDFVLERSTSGVSLISAARWKLDRLREFNQTAYDLFDRAIALRIPMDIEAEKAIESEFIAWQHTVADFLLKRWDESHKTKFLPELRKPEPGKSPPKWALNIFGPTTEPTLSGRILAKTKILNTFQDELWREALNG